MELLDQCYSEIINIIRQDDVKLFIPAITNLEHWFSENTINELGRMKCIY